MFVNFGLLTPKMMSRTLLCYSIKFDLCKCNQKISTFGGLTNQRFPSTTP